MRVTDHEIRDSLEAAQLAPRPPRLPVTGAALTSPQRVRHLVVRNVERTPQLHDLGVEYVDEL